MSSSVRYRYFLSLSLMFNFGCLLRCPSTESTHLPRRRVQHLRARPRYQHTLLYCLNHRLVKHTSLWTLGKALVHELLHLRTLHSWCTTFDKSQLGKTEVRLNGMGLRSPLAMGLQPSSSDIYITVSASSILGMQLSITATFALQIVQGISSS